MKPEYIYRTWTSYLFNITTVDAPAWDAVHESIRRHIRRFQNIQPRKKPSPFVLIDIDDEAEFNAFKTALEKLGVPFKVRPDEQTQIFEDAATYTGSSLNFSLPHMGEYSLELWARANQISEAYRLTEEYSRRGCDFLRVWSSGASQGLAKNGHRDEELVFSIQPHRWQTLQAYMQLRFWTPGLWDAASEPYTVLDGAIFALEGYRDGAYKLHYFENPGACNNIPAMHALNFFCETFPEIRPLFNICEE